MTVATNGTKPDQESRSLAALLAAFGTWELDGDASRVYDLADYKCHMTGPARAFLGALIPRLQGEADLGRLENRLAADAPALLEELHGYCADSTSVPEEDFHDRLWQLALPLVARLVNDLGRAIEDCEVHTPADLAERLAGIETTLRRDPQRRALRLLDVDELLGLPAPDFLVDGWVPQRGTATLYGPHGSGKSFLALEIALSVAAGLLCLGRAVKHAGVLYAAGEGQHGIALRVRALMAARGVSASDLRGLFAFLPAAPRLLDAGGTNAFLRQLATLDRPPGLVVIDTLARSFVGGNENSSEDMTRYVDELSRIADHIGGAVLVVHHANKGVGVERGSTVLGASVDAILRLEKDCDAGTLKLSVTKQKDGDPGDPVDLELVPVDGTESCVLSVHEAPESLEGRGLTPERLLQLLVHGCGPNDGLTTRQWEEAAKGSGFGRSSFYGNKGWLNQRGFVRNVGTKRAPIWEPTEKALEEYPEFSPVSPRQSTAAVDSEPCSSVQESTRPFMGARVDSWTEHDTARDPDGADRDPTRHVPDSKGPDHASE